MSSEVIVLSSDDEDDTSRTIKHKRSKIQHLDADLAVIEKLPTDREVKVPEQSSVRCSKGAQAKPVQDEDCCILSYDPGDSMHVPEFQATDADDLVIVGERGSVACRDFPHARHLCVKFPYATTPHEKHCEQCHCYVCDVLAPCIHWGQGRQSSDHCHAFDKDDKWKKLRSQIRSRLVKLAPRSQVPAQQEQVIQPHPRSFKEVPLRPSLRPGENGCMPPSNCNASSRSFDQLAPNFSGMCANWNPYVPLSQSSMLANGPHGNWVATREMNSCQMGNSLNVTDNMTRGFVDYRNPAVNVTTASLSYPVPQAGSHIPYINVQTGIYRQMPMTPNSSVTAPHFTSSQIQHPQTQRTEVYSAVPYNYAQPQHGTPSSQIRHPQTQRTGVYSAVPYNYAQPQHGTPEMSSTRSFAYPVGNMAKDLMTLQNYLLEGISEGLLYQPSTAHDLNVNDTGHLNCSGNPVLPRPLQPLHNGEMESLHNSSGPAEISSSDNSAARFYSAHAANTLASKQADKDMWNIPSNGVRNKKNTEYPLNDGSEMNNSSVLDHTLKLLDEEFWELLEPAAYPGF